MINFRYHVVSLTAVFLALAVGVIAGTTVIDQQLVQGLQRQRNRDAQAKADLREANQALEREVALWQRFGDAVLQPLFAGRLRGKRVVEVTEPEFAGEVADELGDAVVAAGGVRAGRITLTAKLRIEDDPAREQLALALASSTSDRGRLIEEAASRIGARLLTPADPRRDGDLLETLADNGFIELHDLPRGAFPPRDVVLVFLHGTAPETGVDPAVQLGMVRAVAGSLPVAVAEPLGAASSLVDRVRGDGDLSADVATVDHLDTLPGRFSLVSALQDLAGGLPASHYGVRGRATAVAPVVRR